MKKSNQPFQISAEKLDNLKSVQSDRELLALEAAHKSATHIFTPIDEDKLQTEQANEYRSYIQYLTDESAPIPKKQTLIYLCFKTELYSTRLCQDTFEERHLSH